MLMADDTKYPATRSGSGQPCPKPDVRRLLHALRGREAAGAVTTRRTANSAGRLHPGMRWPWLPVSLGGMADASAGFLLAWRGIARGVSAADR